MVQHGPLIRRSNHQIDESPEHWLIQVHPEPELRVLGTFLLSIEITCCTAPGHDDDFDIDTMTNVVLDGARRAPERNRRLRECGVESIVSLESLTVWRFDINPGQSTERRGFLCCLESRVPSLPFRDFSKETAHASFYRTRLVGIGHKTFTGDPIHCVVTNVDERNARGGCSSSFWQIT